MKPSKIQRLGILTSGGDCPGLNAVIRAVVKTARCRYGIEVFGIEDGYLGVLEKRGHVLGASDVTGILHQGGTILGTDNRANPFRVPMMRGKKLIFEDRSDEAVKHLKELGIEALIAVGGDGTLSIANKLSKKGVSVIGIPKTIDNDLSCTDYTFGFDTAVSITTEALDRLHTTASAHHRVMILEVMGRNAGWIALYAGSAGGADVILIPEIPFNVQNICEAVTERSLHGKRYSLIVVAEGAFEAGKKVIEKAPDKLNPYPTKLGGIGEYLRHQIEKITGLETRTANLGHIQRGGSPTAYDRNLGTLFGKAAVDLVAEKKWNHMVGFVGNEIRSFPISKAVSRVKTVPHNHRLIKAGKAIRISFGNEL